MSRIKMPTFSIRLDEQQLLDLAAKARLHCSKKAYLHKSADPKLKKLTQRWCCLYQNLLFYFESESVPKPLGVVLLEGSVCKPVEQAGQTEGAFSICSSEGSNGKVHYFIAKNDRERNEWLESLTNANMSRLQQELEELRARCGEFDHIMSTKNSEVQHLKEANQQAQQDIDHLRSALQCASTRHRSSGAISLPSVSESDYPDNLDQKARVLQGYIKGWLIRRRWKKIIKQYMNSPPSDMIKKRNQLIWKFIASEEDYVSQLTVLTEEYKQQFEMAAVSSRPPLTLEQSNILFRNSNELLVLHQLFLRGLHECINKWPVVIFKDVLKLFTPMFSIYHQFIGDHSYAYDVFSSLLADPYFKVVMDHLQARPSCNGMMLDHLLNMPLKRLSSFIKELQELCAHTSPDHVDYTSISDAITELETIQKMVIDEPCQNESVREVLKIEAMLEGGCRQLLDREQTLIRKGLLQQVRTEDKLSLVSSTRNGGIKLRCQQRHCFLFSKHILLTSRISKKPTDCYKVVKTFPLSRCHVSEYRNTETAELMYRAVKVSCDYGDEVEMCILMAGSVNEKAEWLADISQCVENEKQNKVLHSKCKGEPAELSSRFIRYSTFRTGKEQLVNSGKLDYLLDRLVKINYFGLDFLNTFLMTFPLYTDANTVFDFLENYYWECLQAREKRRGSVTPQAAVRDARAVLSQSFPRSVVPSTNKQFGKNLSISGGTKYSPIAPPNTKTTPSSDITELTGTKMGNEPTNSVSGLLFALKHWICKHFFHFRENTILSEKLECFLENASCNPQLTIIEKNAVTEVSNVYKMQKEAKDELSPIIQLKLSNKFVYLPQKPFECLLLWNPRETAEQLCLIEGALFQRIGSEEILQYFSVRGNKTKAAPNLSALFDHFNRMSLFFMWSIATQTYSSDRSKVLEFLIHVAWECNQLQNFSSLMQLMSALEHGTTKRLKSAWDYTPKNIKVQFRHLCQLVSTDSRFKELRNAMKKAVSPTVPYLGILLSEMSGVVEGTPTYLEDSLINFNKMRRCVRLITNVLQHQKDPYEFNFIPEVCNVLLHTLIPGNEDELYKFVDEVQDK